MDPGTSVTALPTRQLGRQLGVQIFHPLKFDFSSQTKLEVLSMTGRRERGGGMGLLEGGQQKLVAKEKNLLGWKKSNYAGV